MLSVCGGVKSVRCHLFGPHMDLASQILSVGGLATPDRKRLAQLTSCLTNDSLRSGHGHITDFESGDLGHARRVILSMPYTVVGAVVQRGQNVLSHQRHDPGSKLGGPSPCQ